MFLKEFEGRELFRKYGVPVARSVLIRNADELDEKVRFFLEKVGDVEEFVVKAQLLSGKRGKRGGILFAKEDHLADTVRQLLGSEIGNEVVEEVLIQEKVSIASEFYLSVLVDRFLRRPMVIFSEEGGMDIEELAKTSPEKVVQIPIEVGLKGIEAKAVLEEEFEKRGVLEQGSRNMLIDICAELLEVFYKEEALLVEVNPLILSEEGKLIAVDSKTIIDNNALERHPEFGHESVRGQTELELKARELDLAYVELAGDVAIVGNGAGLVMATLDAVESYGGKPANFCDVGGGASAEKVAQALNIVLEKKGVRKLFLNIFGGITHCDEVAQGIVDAVGKMSNAPDMVIRMVGTNEKEAHTILKNAGFDVFLSFEEAAQKVAQ